MGTRQMSTEGQAEEGEKAAKPEDSLPETQSKDEGKKNQNLVSRWIAGINNDPSFSGVRDMFYLYKKTRMIMGEKLMVPNSKSDVLLKKVMYAIPPRITEKDVQTFKILDQVKSYADSHVMIRRSKYEGHSIESSPVEISPSEPHLADKSINEQPSIESIQAGADPIEIISYEYPSDEPYPIEPLLIESPHADLVEVAPIESSSIKPTLDETSSVEPAPIEVPNRFENLDFPRMSQDVICKTVVDMIVEGVAPPRKSFEVKVLYPVVIAILESGYNDPSDSIKRMMQILARKYGHGEGALPSIAKRFLDEAKGWNPRARRDGMGTEPSNQAQKHYSIATSRA